jgi:uncharacterized protein (TIGR01777 family)
MDVVVAGGTGYLGSALVRALRSKGHHVWVLTRHPRQPDHIGWPADNASDWPRAFRQAGVLINLAGAPLVGPRWTPARKALIRESRVRTTSLLVNALMASPKPPVLINGSAVGLYGARDDEPATEQTTPGSDFLASVVRDWEQAAAAAERATRVVLLRTGVVLSKEGGALPKLALPFRFLLGGPVGSGQQYVSWIHRDDWVSMVQWAIATPTVSGPLNATAPHPVTNEELAKALGAALRRPAIVRTPAAVLRLVLGEMADAALLTGQRVLPAKAQSLGFRFAYPTIDDAFRSIYKT